VKFKTYLQENAQKIEQELDHILSQFLVETKKISPKLLPLIEEFTNSCQGGKRIRGVLVNLGYELARGKGREIVSIGAALEILHTAILAHDDIVDKNPTRRGKASLYTRVGIDQAINLGDLGFFLAIKIISESNFPEIAKNEALQLFSKVMIDTAAGQILDLEKDDPLIVARLKTAQYTISGPLILGSLLGGADEQLIRTLREFGENLGIAFQIKDDILDGEAVDYSISDALKYANQASRFIPKITSDPKTRKLLKEMVEYMVERTR